jgi:predicted Mrr-cat superfamily restriction endonuclease
MNKSPSEMMTSSDQSDIQSSIQLFEQLLPYYIFSFKKRLPILEKETGYGDLSGSERRLWLQKEIQQHFSLENLGKLTPEILINIFIRLFAIRGGNAKPEAQKDWAESIITDNGLEQFKAELTNLLYGKDDFTIRYTQFLKNTKNIKHSLASEILCNYDPTKYASLNKPAEEALELLHIGAISGQRDGTQSGIYYQKFTEKIQYIRKKLQEDPEFSSADLSFVDYFLYGVKSIGYWQISPGANAIYWDEFRDTSRIGIFFSEYIKNIDNETLSLDKDALFLKIKEQNPNITRKTCDIIFRFIHNVRPGDFILANKGLKIALGWGIVESEVKINNSNMGEYSVYYEVNWKEELNQTVPIEVGNRFHTTISTLSEDEFKKILIGGSMPIVEDSTRNYWNILPSSRMGETPFDPKKQWDIWIRRGIVGISWKTLAEKYGKNLLTFSDHQRFKEKFQEAYPDLSPPQTGAQVYMPYNFLFVVKEGDTVTASNGRKSIIGRGKIVSGPKIDLSLDFPIYRDIEWEVFPEEIPIPPHLSSKMVTKRFKAVKKSVYDAIFSGISLPDDPKEFGEIQRLLNHKKQIIMYGPPGTGKTYLAAKFLETKTTQTYTIENTVFNGKFFWLTANNAIWNVEELWSNELTVITYGRIQSAFRDIDPGDLIFVYQTYPKMQILGIARCIQKDQDKNGNPMAIIKGVKRFDGPLFADLAKDAILSEAKPIIMRAHTTLAPLTTTEGLRLLELAKIDPAEIQLQVETDSQSVKNYEVITFHPSFAYEDFIEGLRPVRTDEGQISYEVVEGIFKELTRRSFNALMSESNLNHEWVDGKSVPQLTDKEREVIKDKIDQFPFYLLIDEINRGDIARIFGELITLLEADKRLTGDNEFFTVTLPYSKTKFAIPPNLYIIGTMNTADKSIALIDTALRRRFGFIEIMPNADILDEILVSEDPLVQEIYSLVPPLLISINEKIRHLFDRDHQIGHSYFTKLVDCSTQMECIDLLQYIWYYEILPLLQEYFYESPQKFKNVVGESFVLVDEKGKSFIFAEMLEGEEFINSIKDLIPKTFPTEFSGVIEE